MATQAHAGTDAAPTVTGTVNYIARTPDRPRYHANDSSRDTIVLDPATVAIADARGRADPPRLDREGFQLVDHVSRVADFRDADAVAAVHRDEVRDLLLAVSGADAVVLTSPGILRFAERSDLSGALDNSRPARFVHIDISDTTAAAFAARTNPRPDATPVRVIHYNVWRVITPPPQDAPLAVCDARTVADADRLLADAVFDSPGKPEWAFEGLVVAQNPAHRWTYWSGMTRDEALVFVTNDSAAGTPHNVPHSAFDNPACPSDAPPRGSIEMRGIAYWY